MAIGEEAIVADAVEAVRQGVHQEAADELVGAERHELRLAVVAIILPAEGDVGAGQADQSGVGDGDAMGISAEIGQHLGRAAEGRLGIDDPVDLAHGAEAVSEGGRLGKAGEFAEEAEITGFEGSPQLVEEQPAEEPREHADRQEEAGTTGDPSCSIERRSAARHDAMDVRMMVQVLAPGMEHGEESNT